MNKRIRKVIDYGGAKMSKGAIMATTENEISLEHCILKDRLSSCIRDRCTYRDSDLRCCIRVSLKMTKADRQAWRAKKRAEIAAGGDR